MAPPLKLRRIDCADPKAPKQLTDLRRLFCSQGEVLTPKARELSKRVFGEALPPARAVARICADVQAKGLPAVLHYAEQFDKVKLDASTFRVPAEEMRAAHAKADPDFLETIRNIRQNVIAFQMGLLHTDAVLTVSGSHELQLRYRPMRRVGVCVPGGAAAYPSTLIMTVCPAQAAGVPEIAVVMPPTPSGAYNPDLLAVCYEIGVTEVYRVGGAQAVAALAYGVDGLPPVDMIVGPGNLYVTLAKKHVFGQVAIDCLAGPSEVVVIGDESSQPEFVAADLIAQAEHSFDAKCVLVTWHEPLLDDVTAALDRQLAKLTRGDLARESLERFGAMIKVSDKQEDDKVMIIL
jgi:histidinol dehydrogenase